MNDIFHLTEAQNLTFKIHQSSVAIFNEICMKKSIKLNVYSIFVHASSSNRCKLILVSSFTKRGYLDKVHVVIT